MQGGSGADHIYPLFTLIILSNEHGLPLPQALRLLIEFRKGGGGLLYLMPHAVCCNCMELYNIPLKCLLCRVSGEVKDADEVRTLIKDIWDIRGAKLRKSINKMINHDTGGGKPLSHVEVSSSGYFQ